MRTRPDIKFIKHKAVVSNLFKKNFPNEKYWTEGTLTIVSANHIYYSVKNKQSITGAFYPEELNILSNTVDESDYKDVSHLLDL